MTTPPSTGPLVPTDREFRRFADLIERETGIHLPIHKKVILAGRLSKRLRHLGLSSFESYYERITSGIDDELLHLIDHVSNNVTRFFREPEHFQVLERRILPELRARAASGARPRRIRVWSAGCSTGEEPYTIAMVLLANFPAGSGWQFEIVATDISMRALERANRAVWSIKSESDIPLAYRKRFMLRGIGSKAGTMKAGPELRPLIRFARVNLLDAPPLVPGSFDLVFCRNVLIYFETEARRRVIASLFSQLLPHGYLFLGHAESLTGMGEVANCVGNTVYRPRQVGS